MLFSVGKYAQLFGRSVTTRSVKIGCLRQSCLAGGSRCHPIAQPQFKVRASMLRTTNFCHRSNSVTFKTYPYLTSSSFHTSPHRYVNPVLWIVLKPLTKLWVIVWGRSFRQWWKNASASDRLHIKKLIGESWHILASIACIIIALLSVYYVSHLQVSPITGRRRFLVLTPHQMQTVAAAERNLLLESLQTKLLPSNHAMHASVKAIVKRLVESNDDVDIMRHSKWEVAVIDDATIVNALVLPTGDILVFTGLFKLVKNVDQLAIILAHEISHVLLSHAAEHLSFAQLLDFTVIAVMAALWLFLPSDGIAVIAQWFYGRVLKIAADMPYSRLLEKEADEVGLLLAAKACFDVREGPAFWKSMDSMAKDNGEIVLPALLSTHPTHDSRIEHLTAKLPEALQMRAQCGCAPLPISGHSELPLLRRG